MKQISTKSAVNPRNKTNQATAGPCSKPSPFKVGPAANKKAQKTFAGLQDFFGESKAKQAKLRSPGAAAANGSRKQQRKEGSKMLQSKSFVRKTKQGKVLKVVREHYLRDDIYCGASICKVCDSSAARLSSSASPILIVDTNVVLHQIDLLENPAINDVVVLSVVLEEVRNKNLSVYNRLRALCSNNARKFFVFSNEHHKDTFVKAMVGESPNDRNDRAIRVAASWYQSHLGGSASVLLITNDKENKRKATEEGISAETVESYVKSLGEPSLLDLVVNTSSEDVSMADVEDLRPSKRKVIYSEHKPMSEITSGLHRGIYHQGKLRVNRYNPFEAYVGSESIGDEIIIHGRNNMNRAFDGDIVAVELLPQEQWTEGKSLSIADDEEEDEEDVHLVPGSADDAPRNTNIAGAATTTNPISCRPVGHVVGIIKRNWHSYCGSLEPMPMPAGNGGIAHALFVSKDRRIPKIRIQTRQLGNLLDKRIIVAVDSWDVLSRYPSGHYVRTIGEIGDRDTESEASLMRLVISLSCSYAIKVGIVVLIENSIESRPFSAQVLACLPPLPWALSTEDLANPSRQDLRHIRVFSVDPPEGKLVDLRLQNIADVTNFVHPGTPLDEEASKRGTSVYLVERRIDMLPKPLTEDICSLRADVERLAFSVIWVSLMSVGQPDLRLVLSALLSYDGRAISLPVPLNSLLPPSLSCSKVEFFCAYHRPTFYDWSTRRGENAPYLSTIPSLVGLAFPSASQRCIQPSELAWLFPPPRGVSSSLIDLAISLILQSCFQPLRFGLSLEYTIISHDLLWHPLPEMTPDAEIISTRYTRSVIKSCAALSYVEAQARMDDSRLMDPLTTDLRNLNALAKIMRQRRIERGALTLASPEVKFQIDTETHDPLDIGMYQIREANQMIEEFMLAANVSVAEKILKHFPLCSLLRRHPSPTNEMLEPLLRTTAAVGLDLDVSTSKAFADSLDRAVGDDPYFNKLIRILATRCMTQAVYFCSGDLSYPEFYHYGLAAPLYTHFTSPIRRYADVIVHRLLAAALGISKLPPIFQDRPQLTSISDNLNYRHRNAQMASRASVELHTLIFFRKRYGIEGPVYLIQKGKNTGEWTVDEEHQRMRKADGSINYSILQTVRIHMEVVEPQPNRPKLELTLI
ncbi:Exosome complex exonuclease RRP44 A [Asimina triloba]